MSIETFIRRSGHVVDVERPTVTRGEAGGRVQAWAAVKSDCEVWAQPASSGVMESYLRRNIVVTHMVFSAYDLDVQEGDRLKFDTRYLVVRGIRNTAELGRVWRLDCEETV